MHFSKFPLVTNYCGHEEVHVRTQPVGGRKVHEDITEENEHEEQGKEQTEENKEEEYSKK